MQDLLKGIKEEYLKLLSEEFSEKPKQEEEDMISEVETEEEVCPVCGGDGLIKGEEGLAEEPCYECGGEGTVQNDSKKEEVPEETPKEEVPEESPKEEEPIKEEDEEEDDDEDKIDPMIHNGSFVTFKNEGPNGEVYKVSNLDKERGRCWVGDKDNRGWNTYISDLKISNKKFDDTEDEEDLDEAQPEPESEPQEEYPTVECECGVEYDSSEGSCPSCGKMAKYYAKPLSEKCKAKQVAIHECYEKYITRIITKEE